jgi:hypothetical protein
MKCREGEGSFATIVDSLSETLSTAFEEWSSVTLVGALAGRYSLVSFSPPLANFEGWTHTPVGGDP